MTELSELDQEVEVLNKQIKEREKARKEELDRLSAEVARLEADRAAKLAELEEARISDWKKARMSIPEFTNRELIEHKVNLLYEAVGWKKPSYIVYSSSPSHFSRHGQDRSYGNWMTRLNSEGKYPEDKTTNIGRLNVLKNLCEASPSRQELSRRDPYHHWEQRVLHLVPKIHDSTVKGARELLSLVDDIVEIAPGPKVAVVLEKPAMVKLNAVGQLHCPDGPAIIWRDNSRKWYFNGVECGQTFCEAPVTLARVRNERNTERRRVLLERFGYDKYLQDTKAKLVHKDSTGKLWKIVGRNVPGGFWNTRKRMTEYKLEDEYYVEVENSTPEPDGSIRKFLLRVPPSMTKAKAAVAWTFGKSEKEYSPKAES